MSSAITFTGLGSGIDMSSIVSAIIEAETASYITPIEEWKTTWENKITAFQELNTKLVTLETSVKDLDSQSEFLVKTASSTDTSILNATADDTASSGSYEVIVEQLAKSEKETHAGHADEDSTAVTNSAGTFSYTYNGTSRTINVIAGSTLTDLVDLINNDSQNPGVTAKILDDGSGTSTACHLVLTGNSTGESYSITAVSHTLDNFGTGGTTGGGFSETQQAQNSKIKVDGYPSSTDSFIERSTNTISDVITGITISLVGEGTATVTASTDTSAIKEKITAFVDAFNEVRTYIADNTNYDTDNDEVGILLGNYAVDTVKNRLNDIISSSPSGFRDGYDTYINLMQIGISTDAESGSGTEGLLIIDEDALDEALSDDPEAVAELFSDSYTGRSAHANLVYDSSLEGITEPGTYEIKFTSGTPPSGQMRLKGTSEWHDAVWDNTTQTLTGADGYAEAGLAVKVTDTSVSFTGEVDLKRGVAGDLKAELDSLTDSDDGPMAILEDNYQNIIDNADDKIDRETTRIALLEERLTARYARLEELLTELEGQQTQLENLISSLEE